MHRTQTLTHSSHPMAVLGEGHVVHSGEDQGSLVRPRHIVQAGHINLEGRGGGGRGGGGGGGGRGGGGQQQEGLPVLIVVTIQDVCKHIIALQSNYKC